MIDPSSFVADTESHDPLPDMVAEYDRVVAAFCLLHEDDVLSGALNQAFSALEDRICTTPAVTSAGLLAQAEFVRERIAEDYGCSPKGEDKRADHERGVDTIVEGLRHLLGRPASITTHLPAAGTDPLPELVAEWKRRRALEPKAETEDEIEASGNHTDEMDRPICFAKPQSVAGIKAQAEFIRFQLEAWGEIGIGEELSCIVNHFFDAVAALSDGPAVPVGAVHPQTKDERPTGSTSPLHALYARWRAAKADYRDLPPDRPDADHDAAYARIREIELEAMAYEPKTMEDLALQIIIADDDGDMSANTDQEALAARAYVLAGIERPSTGDGK